ncbi:MAG: hypothetical protein Phyf2KO_09810 [Phycisphaerales bacterium]
MASPQDLVPVSDAAGPGEAHIIASMLRENGIEAFVFDTAAQTLQWDAPRIINPYMVHIQRADLERARQLIASNREASVDLDWDEVDVGEPEHERVEGTTPPAKSAGSFLPLRWKNLHRWVFLGLLLYLAFSLVRSVFGAISGSV